MLEMFNRDMLKDPPNLDDIISVAPCARTVAAARRMAADKIDFDASIEINDVPLPMVVADDGNKKKIKYKVMLLAGYHIVLDRIWEHLIDTTQVLSGTAVASATTITKTLTRFGSPHLGGQCTDNASYNGRRGGSGARGSRGRAGGRGSRGRAGGQVGHDR